MVITETLEQELGAYFNHYFREWAAKCSALDIYKVCINGETSEERELFNDAVETLKTPIRTYEERIERDYPAKVAPVVKRFGDDVARVNALAGEYNANYRCFAEEPNCEGIERMINRAFELKEEFNRGNNL